MRIQYAIDHYDKIKFDTHVKNKAMLASIKKFGFIHCGEIAIADGTPHQVFQYTKEQ
ncbi:hypothetical protein ACF3NG_01795 [Aerococcaceae bacterium WGS1372]